MKRIKRTISVIMCAALLLGLLPTVALAATEISAVTVSVTAPDTGKTTADAAVTANGAANYYVKSYDWYKVAAKGSTESLWWLYDNDTFEDGNWYMAEITLYADFGYEFSNSITPTVSGAEQVSAESDDDTLEVYAWFKVGSPADTQTISAVTVTGVVTPAVGASIWDTENSIKANAATGTGYSIDYVNICKWEEGTAYWSWVYSGNFEADTAYGVKLRLRAGAGYAFADPVTSATINEKDAEVLSRTADELTVFLSFNDSVTITQAAVKSAVWPIDGNPIPTASDNFSLSSYSNLAYTLQSAKFQIKDGDIYRDLNPGETHFSNINSYRVQAVLQARDYAVFADSVTGDFNGTSDTECVITDGGKTCTVTRTCAVYDAVYSYKNSTPSTHVNGVTLHLPNPANGVSYSDDYWGSYGTTSDPGHLVGAHGYTSWYEVPYVGSTGSIKELVETDAFEDGKVYRMEVTFRNQDGCRFGEGFAVNFKQMDGTTESGYAMKTCVTDTASTKTYYVWYTVGTVTPQQITEVTITGPALQSDGTVGTTSPSAFNVSTGAVIDKNNNSGIWGPIYCSDRYLTFYLNPASGYYFGRSVAVTYNGIFAEVTIPGNYFLSPYDSVRASVDLCQPVTWSGALKAQDKVYDGTTTAHLDFSDVTLNGINPGDDVQLSDQYAGVYFADAAVGENKTVTVPSWENELSLVGNDAWKYRLENPYLYGMTFTASITAAPTPTPDPDPSPAPVDPVIPIVITYPVTAAQPENGAVTVSPANAAAGVTVTVTVTPDAGYELASLTVTDASGKDIALTDKGDGKYTFTMPAGKVSVNAAFSRVALPFTDVPADAYYYDAVAWAVENKITEGTGDGTTFSPNAPCTRGQIVTFLWRAAGCPEPESSVNPFTDVEEDAYYFKAMLWAVENGITIGTGNGTTFSPDAVCTRDQAVTFLWRAVEKPAATAGQSFTDVPADAYYASAVQWAVANGVTIGTGDGTTFSPADDCDRSQIVTFLYRTYAK